MTMLGMWLAVSLLSVWPADSERAPVFFSSEIQPLASAIVTTTSVMAGSSATFTVSDKLQVPGKTLHGGSYSIRVLDHLSDRMIVRIDHNGKILSTFIALPKSSLNNSSGQGPIRIGNGSKQALRGFVFPDGTVAEFVFPKAEAVGLAKENGITVPAIDPASEGISDTQHLSSDDMQMVTLWMLTPTQVGPDGVGAGIAAAKYQAPEMVANAHTLPPPNAASRRAKPVMAALPHTASDMPVVELTGLFALGMAGWMTRRRVIR